MFFCYKKKGVQKLLDSVVDYLPSPVDVWDINGTDPATGEKKTRHVGDLQPFSALMFKIMTDPFVGKLYYFRVYSGVASQGAVLTAVYPFEIALASAISNVPVISLTVAVSLFVKVSTLYFQ